MKITQKVQSSNLGDRYFGRQSVYAPHVEMIVVFRLNEEAKWWISVTGFALIPFLILNRFILVCHSEFAKAFADLG